MATENNGVGNDNGSSAPSFKLILVTVLILTLVSLTAAALVIYWMAGHIPTQAYVSDDVRAAAVTVRESAKLISDKLMDVFVLGCGAIIGLLGGRSAK